MKSLTAILFIIVIALVLSAGTAGAQAAVIIGTSPAALEIKTLDESNAGFTDLQNLKGNVVLLDFWASWCAPCISAFPHMNDLAEKYTGRPLKIISITYEPAGKIMPLLEKKKLNTIIAIDNDFHTFRKFNAWAIPNIVMIGKDGKIAGRIHPNKLDEKVIDALLDGKMPDVEQTPENLFKPDEAEKYFRSTLEEKK